jgi:anti-sigma B factor antagonist
MTNMPERSANAAGLPDIPDGLQISIHSDNARVVMYLQGLLTMASSPGLRDHLLAVLRRPSPPESIAVDVAEVSYMDTSGIATLIEALKIARIGGIAMHVQGLQGDLLHLFQATGIGSLFDEPGSGNGSTPMVS